MNQRRTHILLLILALLAFFTGINILELRAEEPRRAVVALEMLLRKDWIVPTIHGWPYYNKPPLYNWILAAFIWILNSSQEWVIRLPGLLSIFALAIFQFFLLRKYFDKQLAWIAAFMILASGDMLLYGSVNAGEIDLFFMLIVWLQASVLFIGVQRQKPAFFFPIVYFLLAIGILTKGLPAVLFLGFTLIAYLSFERKLKYLWSPTHFLGILIGFGIPALYFYQYGRYQDVGFYLANLVGEATEKSAFQKDWLAVLKQTTLFPFKLLLFIAPWSLIIFTRFFKRDSLKIDGNALLKFALIFIAANIWLYWLSPKSGPRYLYPFLPALTLLTAYWVYQSKYISKKAIYLTIAILLIARIGYNIWGMPYQQLHNNHMVYREITNKILQITGNNPVHLTGEPDNWDAKFGLFQHQFYQASKDIPPILPYQIPYYLSTANHRIMEYDPDPQACNYYIQYAETLQPGHGQILYSFTEKWTKRTMVLVLY